MRKFKFKMGFSGLLIVALILIGVGVYFLCLEDPRIQKIADKHIDAVANGLMTYASISVGFVITEFAIFMSYAQSKIFDKWKRNGLFKGWIYIHMLALIGAIAVLISSFILLGCEDTMPLVIAILSVNTICVILLFVPLAMIGMSMLADFEAVHGQK